MQGERHGAPRCQENIEVLRINTAGPGNIPLLSYFLFFQVTSVQSSSDRRLLCTYVRTSWRGWTPQSLITACNGTAPCVWRTAQVWKSNASCPKPSRVHCLPSSSRRWEHRGISYFRSDIKDFYKTMNSLTLCVPFCVSVLSVAPGWAWERPKAGVSHRSVPGKAPWPGGEQPTGSYRDAAEAYAEQSDHWVFLCARQHGHVFALYGGR